MTGFSQRCEAPEYMDVASVRGPDLERALAELRHINRFLGGCSASLKGMETVLQPAENRTVEILDIGTGAADIPAALVPWARARGINVRIVAVDFNPAVCAWAAARTSHLPEVDVQQADVFDLPYVPGSFDCVHCAMFLHHFPQEDAARILRIMYDLSRSGIVVNDLHRHPFAFYSIQWITRCFSGSRMVRHDAPVSVLRGFRRPELEELGHLSGINHLSINRSWAFRFTATAVKS